MAINVIHSNAMNYRVERRTQEPDYVVPGKQSPMTDLLTRLQSLKKHERIVVETTPLTQRQVARRLRSNIFKWKQRKGLKHVSVHIKKDGNVALEIDE